MLVLIRHASTSSAENGIPQSFNDGLSKLGIRQACETGAYLSSWKIVGLLASDMTRTLQTASILGRYIGLCPKTDPKFREVPSISEGDLSIAVRRESHRRYRLATQQLMLACDDAGLRARSLKGIVVIVTHAQAISWLAWQRNHYESAISLNDEYVDNCSLTGVKGMRVVFFNRSQHLRAVHKQSSWNDRASSQGRAVSQENGAHGHKVNDSLVEQ